MVDLAKLDELIARVEKGRDLSNALDIEIEIALFQPDEVYASVAPNHAGTKVVYTRHSGKTNTFWAMDHTLDELNRSRAVDRLKALRESSERGGGRWVRN